MQTRRQIIKTLTSATMGLGLLCTKLGPSLSLAWAKAAKILLPKETAMETLISKNPARLDTRLLPTTPMDQFGVMGQDIYDVDLDRWRLALSGTDALTYDQVLDLPSQERHVLLVCRGFFAYNALWKGVSMPELLKRTGLNSHAARVRFSGPEGIRRKRKTFDMEEVMANKVFIAYQVNGQPLPMRHGFPLRLVAEDHYGSRWVKYVNRIDILET